MLPNSSDRYPVSGTGPLIARASLEHSWNTSTSLELTSVAAVTCAAAVVQDIADVQRPDMMPSPTSVLCIAVAESGEGKSTAAKPFLRTFEQAQEILDAGGASKTQLDVDTVIWKEKLGFLRAKYRRLMNEDESTEAIEEEIARHIVGRPGVPTRPRLLYDNVTPTALGRSLPIWPSAFIASMDAGHVLNGAMGRAFDFLNSVWDGDTIRSETTSESWTAYRPRATALLYAQPKPTMRYFRRRGEDAQGTGFFARVDWAFTAPIKSSLPINFGPKSHDSIEAYQARAAGLLEERIRTRKAGHGKRRIVGFSLDGQAYFRGVLERVLPMSAPGGPLQGHGGYVAKLPERIARYACILHVFNDLPGLIGAETLHNAEMIVQWHTRQFLNLMHATSPQTQVMHDSDWLARLLVNAANRSETVRPADLSRLCPADWTRPRRHRALQALCETGRARIERWRRIEFVQLTCVPMPFSIAADQCARSGRGAREIFT